MRYFPPPYDLPGAPSPGNTMALQRGGMMSAPQYLAQLESNFDASVLARIYSRKLEWLFVIPFSLVVPASGGNDDEVNIRSDAHFQSEFITGDFTTLNAGPVDAGANLLSLRITDLSNDLKLMDDFIPLNLFLSPGRVLSPGVAGNPSQALFYPIPFQHLFPANGGIGVEAQNTGTFQNTFNLLFWGRKLRASEASKTAAG